MCIVGNHETVEKGVYSLPYTHRVLFEYPQAGVPDSLKDQTYSFNYGNIHFIALDTQAIEEGIAGQTDVDQLQTEWLLNDLEANKLRVIRTGRSSSCTSPFTVPEVLNQTTL
jgi:hypothetical protein